jgi:hypothetical protein
MPGRMSKDMSKKSVRSDRMPERMSENMSKKNLRLNGKDRSNRIWGKRKTD